MKRRTRLELEHQARVVGQGRLDRLPHPVCPIIIIAPWASWRGEQPLSKHGSKLQLASA